MKLYLRCVWANKFTFAGYIWVAGTLVIRWSQFDIDTMLLAYPGIFLLCMTAFGCETLEYYKRAAKNIKLYGVDRVTYGFKAQNAYCRKTGINMALRDYQTR